MPGFAAYDGTSLAYNLSGAGSSIVSLPGGPMQDSAYLGDLGGLNSRLEVIMLDLRGTGDSGTPADKGSYRCDRLVDDVEALREHLGLAQMSLLGHSAGANLAVLYAARHRERIGRLVLITPSTFAVDITATAEMRRAIVRRREGEPWYAAASAAFERIAAGQGTENDWAAITPFTYGRWDAAAQAHHADEERQRNAEAAAVFRAEGAYHPSDTRAALATLEAPTLLLSGEFDVGAPPPVIDEFAGIFPNATHVTQPGAGHFPWLDDPAWFADAVAAFVE